MLGQSSSFKKFGMVVGAVQVLPMSIKPPFIYGNESGY